MEGRLAELDVALATPPPSPVRFHPNIAETYRRKVQRSFDKQDKEYRKLQRCAEQKLAVRTANAFDAEVTPYVADMREFAAHMICLETLEQRNLGRGRAIEQASKATWDDLSPQKRRKARLYLADSVPPGDNTRRPAREVGFLRSVAALVKQATGRRVPFSSAPDSQSANRPRHYGMEFDVMIAAAEMADHRLSNEAMARLIQRIRQQ